MRKWAGKTAPKRGKVGSEHWKWKDDETEESNFSLFLFFS